MADLIAWLAAPHSWPFVLAILVGTGPLLLEAVLGGVLQGLDLDLDADVDADADADADIEGGPVAGALEWLGVGKVPLSLLVEVMLIAFGATGLLVNGIAEDLVPGGARVAWPVAMLVGAGVAVLVTRTVGGWVARLAPNGDAALSPADLVGRTGVAASRISGRIGQIRVDDGDARGLLNAFSAHGDDIARGAPVLIVGWDPARHTFAVAPADLA